MGLLQLVKRTVFFYWRTNLGVLLTVVVSAAVLTGALAIGDSIHHSLIMMVKARLGDVDHALVARGRFFREALADDLSSSLDGRVAPLLHVRGMIASGDGSDRANRIEIYGVDDRFYAVGPGPDLFAGGREGVVLNTKLADRIAVEAGDDVVLRMEQPGQMSRDLPLTPDTGLSTAFRLPVKAVASAGEFGRFNLQANQIAPLNAFVPLQWLQQQLGRERQANVLLAAGKGDQSISVDALDDGIRDQWQLADAELELRRLDRRDVFELRSKRVFIGDSVADAALDMQDGAQAILTYFVNSITAGEQATPFSMVAGLTPADDPNALVQTEMTDDEIVVNQWLADDLGVREGERVEMVYYVLGSMRELIEARRSFKVRSVVPLAGPALDPNLMPDFPGLADAENCRDWDSGIPIDLDRIRDKDEDYWDQYRGTPKAFVTLNAAEAMWANRYGSLTAVRYPAGATSRDSIAESLLDQIDPATMGLFFRPVREQGMQAGGGSTDFTQLFVGLSVFLVVAAVLLTGLVFVFGVESRAEQIGMLKAFGLSPRQLKLLFCTEGMVLSVIGSAVGALAGLLYADVMIYALTTVWSGAIAGSQIAFHIDTITLFQGPAIAVLVSLGAMYLALRKQVTRSARELLAGQLEMQGAASPGRSRGRYAPAIAVIGVLGAVGVLLGFGGGDSGAASGAFFGAGALLLISGLAITHAILTRLRARYARPLVSLAGLGIRNTSRRTGRSVAVVALLACGIFLTIAVGANRKDPVGQILKRDSGTGGFALYGESSLPVIHDLNDDDTRAELGFDDEVLQGVRVVQMRLREGDDASCFNLNRAQVPPLFGVKTEELAERGAFVFRDMAEPFDIEDGWSVLEEDVGSDVVPAVGDYATVYWALGKSLGDEIELADEEGRSFRVRIVGMLKNSILQGGLVISEDDFVERYPSEEGYRILLIDAPEERIEAVAGAFRRRMVDYGLSITDTRQRLAEFSTVQNMYLSIFQTLGGLSLVLGSIGLGLVVLRNILERRGELGMLQAVGFDKDTLKRMVFYEHWGLMLAGLVCGLVAAVVAVGPAIDSPGSDIPYNSLLPTIAAIAISGLIWIWLASTLALKGTMLDAIRNE